MKSHIDLIGQLAGDLAAGTVDRMLPPQLQRHRAPKPRDAQPRPAFEFLKKNIADLRQLIVKVTHPKTDVTITVDLLDMTDGRLTGDNSRFRDTTPAQQISMALSDLSVMAKLTSQTLRTRLEPPGRTKLWLDMSRGCLDLRKMAVDPAYPTSATAQDALKWLLHHLRQRDRTTPPPTVLVDDMPADAVVQTQFEQICERMRAAHSERAFQHWHGASGTIIKVDLFCMPRFYKGNEDYLYLFAQFATKSMDEAVLEGA